MTVFYGPRPNDSNIVGHNMFCTVGHFVVTCCNMCVVGSSLKMVKFGASKQHFAATMLQSPGQGFTLWL